MMKGADVPACEVVVDGRLRATGAGGVPRLRERYVPVANHMFIISATGARTLFEQHAAIVAGWFDSVSFILRG
jgi:hypothetical protein